jgi:UDP-N-acetyl-D-glucosamine dehydrogenase
MSREANVSGPEPSLGQLDGCPSVGLIGAARECAELRRTFSSRGFSVVAFEVNCEGVPRTTAVSSPLVDADLFHLGEPDALIVCTPVALTPARGADTSALADTVRTVAGRLRRGQLVLLAVPAPPGTTRRLLLPLLAASGLTVGRDFFLACSPPSTAVEGRVVGGLDEASARAALALWARAGVPASGVSSPEAAEVCAAVAPVLAAVRAAAVNELRLACDRMGVDAWEVLAASGQPALALPISGCCPELPLLAWGARQWGASFGLLEGATQLNAAMSSYVIWKVVDALNAAGKAVRGSRVVILGVSDERDADAPQKTTGFELLELLREKGAVVTYDDPRAHGVPGMGHRAHPAPAESRTLTPEYLAAQDCVLIATDHPAYDYEFIVRHSRLVVDTHNATRSVTSGRERTVRC